MLKILACPRDSGTRINRIPQVSFYSACNLLISSSSGGFSLTFTPFSALISSIALSLALSTVIFSSIILGRSLTLSSWFFPAVILSSVSSVSIVTSTLTLMTLFGLGSAIASCPVSAGTGLQTGLDQLAQDTIAWDCPHD